MELIRELFEIGYCYAMNRLNESKEVYGITLKTKNIFIEDLQVYEKEADPRERTTSASTAEWKTSLFVKDAVIVKHNGKEGTLVFTEKGSDVGRRVISGAELPEGFAPTDGEGSLGSIRKNKIREVSVWNTYFLTFPFFRRYSTTLLLTDSAKNT